ncbi:MAG: aminopeptidase [endosymbiont of Galathealinum brachiosum]|uniref:Aminopeptidase n=1 Tax=endosymbiont of Galathealinum brachiosum TaxID=2200906 RepID=A0A370DMD9_9GAMM|nr:MAG: aminopeptidase [endosymbiont of Galathealinum brachiosum]
MKTNKNKASHRLLLLISISLFCVFLIFSCTTQLNVVMPGHSYNGALPLLTLEQQKIKKQLHRHVYELSEFIGVRNMHEYDNLLRAADYIDIELSQMDYKVTRQQYMLNNRAVDNIVAEKIGIDKPDEIIIIGAHYDSLQYTVGANDNASGVAGILEIARLFKSMQFSRTVRFVAFANEEPPYFKEESMGSYQYAQHVNSMNENVIAMFSIESIGSFSSKAKSQRYPVLFNLFYPDTGNFIAFISNPASRHLMYQSLEIFREEAKFPTEGLVAPEYIPGVDWSDHMSFWNEGYAAVMISDTAIYRDRNYHTSSDTIDHIDFESTTRVVSGLSAMFSKLLGQIEN